MGPPLHLPRIPKPTSLGRGKPTGALPADPQAYELCKDGILDAGEDRGSLTPLKELPPRYLVAGNPDASNHFSVEARRIRPNDAQQCTQWSASIPGTACLR
jgi:hypothetical protein